MTFALLRKYCLPPENQGKRSDALKLNFLRSKVYRYKNVLAAGYVVCGRGHLATFIQQCPWDNFPNLQIQRSDGKGTIKAGDCTELAHLQTL